MNMTPYMDDLLYRINQLDPELAAEVRYEYNRQLGLDRIASAKEHLQDTLREYDDPTGQDLDGPEVEQAARDYIDAQNNYIRETNPDRWSEMRYFGQL